VKKGDKSLSEKFKFRLTFIGIIEWLTPTESIVTSKSMFLKAFLTEFKSLAISTAVSAPKLMSHHYNRLIRSMLFISFNY